MTKWLSVSHLASHAREASYAKFGVCRGTPLTNIEHLMPVADVATLLAESLE